LAMEGARMRAGRKNCSIYFALILLVLGTSAPGNAQQKPAPAPAPASQPAAAPPAKSGSAQPAAAASTAPTYKPEEIEQIVASIALYPDSLISQILMASTYPLEVVEAARWVEQNKSLKGDALAKELEKQTWDPSVKSLVNFPDVLATMNSNLD